MQWTLRRSTGGREDICPRRAHSEAQKYFVYIHAQRGSRRLPMQAYVAYLRCPGSQPLTISQYNRKFKALLDEDLDFQHECLVAWHEGSLQRRGKRGTVLTNAFPNPPALRTAGPLVCGEGEIKVHEWGVPVRSVALSAEQTRALHVYAKDPSSGVPAAVSDLVPECSHKAAVSLITQLDRRSPAPALMRPAVLARVR